MEMVQLMQNTKQRNQYEKHNHWKLFSIRNELVVEPVFSCLGRKQHAATRSLQYLEGT